jgi:3-deoxy-D-manno-octulosonic-acid transferase
MVRREMRLLYNILYPVVFVLLSPVFLFKMVKRGKYRENFFQRFGRYHPDVRQRLATKKGKRCWLQAVSVGEINLALHLIPSLQARVPGLEVVLTTTTSTGYALAKGRLPNGVTLLYFPQDFLPCVNRAYNLIQPDFIVLMESELWPNHIWAAADRDLPIFLVNARMSPRSARRYRRFKWLARHVFRHLTLVGAQSREDADHYAAVIDSPDRVVLTGNMKFDTSLPQKSVAGLDLDQLREDLGMKLNQPVLLGGSTHPGEEEILFGVFQNLRREFPRLFLVIVPRHVERAKEVLDVAVQKGLICLLRSDMKSSLRPKGGQYDCLLVDTTGELKWLYGLATVIFVGKSLVGQGGQNIIEAAASGHPVVFGPHMQNFKEISRLFVEAHAAVQVNDPRGLQLACADLLGDESARTRIAQAAQGVIDANLGATQRTVDLIAGRL